MATNDNGSQPQNGPEVARLGEQPNNDNGGEPNGEDNQNTSTDQADDKGAGAHDADKNDNGDKGDKGADKLEDLPEYWQKEFKRLRDENAKSRISNRDENQSQADRIAALEQELADRRAAEDAAHADMQKTQILADRGLPTKLSHMLTGDGKDDWETAADSLVELRGNKGPTPDPVQVAASKQSNSQTDLERAADAFFSGLNN